MKPEVDYAECCEWVQNANVPPGTDPTWQWLEKNVELEPQMSDMHGRVRFDFFPASKIFFNYTDHPRLQKATVMKCAQSGFTENAVMLLLRRIKEKPVTAMWVGATAEKTEEDAKKRFFPAIRSCAVVRALAPDEKERSRWTKKLIMFDTMNLLIRGANSIGGLRGDPVGILIADERADWKAGRIHKVRQRLTTKAAPIEVSIGAAGLKQDELHVDWLEGSRTVIHFLCLHCQHSQPFRFGKKAGVIYPEDRALGGLVWEENEVTKPDGVWNFEEVKKSTRLQCEKCGHLYHNIEKVSLLKTAHEVHGNPNALPENFSLLVTALLLPWNKRSWGDIAVEFLKAVEAMKMGDIEPMKTFVTETLGEPWELRNEKQAQGELLDRCADYSMGELWPAIKPLPSETYALEEGTTLILTFDRQHMHLVYVVRQWRRNGQSRLVWAGISPSYDDLRAFQLERRIKSRCVWGDDGGMMAAEFRQTCLRFNWQVLKGEDFENFSVSAGDGKPAFRQGWRATEFDPGVGQSFQGRHKMTAYLWSNPWFKDKLYNLFIPGKGPLWQLPRREELPAQYLKEVMANEWREKERSNGQIEGYWHETGPDHFSDCELSQLVVADIGGITRLLPVA